MDCFGNFFPDERIAVIADNFGKLHGRRDDVHMVKGFDKALDLRILKACVGKDGGDIRVKLTGNVEEDGAVLASGKADAYLPLVVLIEFYDPCLRDLDFPVKRKTLKFHQTLCVMDITHLQTP